LRKESLKRLPFTFTHNLILTSNSVGIALFPEDGKEAETLVKNADIAMYLGNRVVGRSEVCRKCNIKKSVPQHTGNSTFLCLNLLSVCWRYPI